MHSVSTWLPCMRENSEIGFVKSVLKLFEKKGYRIFCYLFSHKQSGRSKHSIFRQASDFSLSGVTLHFARNCVFLLKTEETGAVICNHLTFCHILLTAAYFSCWPATAFSQAHWVPRGCSAAKPWNVIFPQMLSEAPSPDDACCSPLRPSGWEGGKSPMHGTSRGRRRVCRAGRPPLLAYYGVWGMSYSFFSVMSRCCESTL